jgi:hypothetical protein
LRDYCCVFLFLYIFILQVVIIFSYFHIFFNFMDKFMLRSGVWTLDILDTWAFLHLTTLL